MLEPDLAAVWTLPLVQTFSAPIMFVYPAEDCRPPSVLFTIAPSPFALIVAPVHSIELTAKEARLSSTTSLYSLLSGVIGDQRAPLFTVRSSRLPLCIEQSLY